MVSYYLFCSVLVLLGQFVFNKWKGLFPDPFLYPIPVVIVSSTGVKRVVGGTERKPKYVQ